MTTAWDYQQTRLFMILSNIQKANPTILQTNKRVGTSRQWIRDRSI